MTAMRGPSTRSVDDPPSPVKSLAGSAMAADRGDAPGQGRLAPRRIPDKRVPRTARTIKRLTNAL